jgi:hypothetical protein
MPPKVSTEEKKKKRKNKCDEKPHPCSICGVHMEIWFPGCTVHRECAGSTVVDTPNGRVLWETTAAPAFSGPVEKKTKKTCYDDGCENDVFTQCEQCEALCCYDHYIWRNGNNTSSGIALCIECEERDKKKPVGCGAIPKEKKRQCYWYGCKDEVANRCNKCNSCFCDNHSGRGNIPMCCNCESIEEEEEEEARKEENKQCSEHGCEDEAYFLCSLCTSRYCVEHFNFNADREGVCMSCNDKQKKEDKKAVKLLSDTKKEKEREEKNKKDLQTTADAFFDNIMEYEEAGVGASISVALIQRLAKRFAVVRSLLRDPPTTGLHIE